MDKLDKSIENFKKNDQFNTDQNFTKQINRFSSQLNEQRKIYDDIFNEGNHKRARRSANDNLRNVANVFSTNYNKIKHNMEIQSNYLNFSMDNLNKTNIFLTKKKIKDDLEYDIKYVKEDVEKLLSMLQRGKFDEHFLFSDDFTQKLDEIEKFLDQQEMLPYGKLHTDYYINIVFKHYVEGKNLILTTQIPFVERESRELYEIYELPAYYNTSLMITNVNWNYMAVGERNVVMFKNIASCLKGKSSTSLFCESQSPILRRQDQSDCLIHAYETHQINLKLCGTTYANFLDLIFIKLGNGEYFFFSPHNNFTLNVTCDGITEIQSFDSKTGIIRFEHTCIVESKKFELRSTQHVIHNATNVDLHIGYVKNELLEILGNITMKIYNDSMMFDKLSDFKYDLSALPKELVDNIVNSSSLSDNIMMVMICGLLITMIIISTLIYLKKRNSTSSQDKEKIVVFVKGNES